MIKFSSGGILVQSLDELPRLDHANELFCDFETTSGNPKEKALRPYHGHRIAGICVTADELPNAWYVPIRCNHPQWNLPLEPTIAWIRGVVGTCKDWVNHEIKFDAHFGLQDGILFNGRLIDTLTLSKIIQSDRFTYGLDVLSFEWLEYDIAPLEKRLKAFLKSCHSQDYGDVPGDIIGEYGCQDVLTTRALYRYCQRRRHEQTIGVWNTEIKLTPVLFDMEVAGMRVDPSELQQKQFVTLYEMSKLEETLHKMTGVAIRPHTNEDCHEVLCTHFGLPVLGYTDTGDPSFDKDVLTSYLAYPLVRDDPKLTDIVTKIQRYRKLHTLNSLFLEVYLNEHVDGLMHPSYNQVIRTGRMSCRRPNAQQLSSEAKELVLPYDDHDLVGYDYCLPAGTLVPTPYGDKPIEIIADQLLPVLSVTHDNELKFCDTSRGARVGYGDIHRITFDDGSTYECTGDHGFVDIDGERVNCKDLLPGRRLAHVVDEPWHNNPQYPAWKFSGRIYNKHCLAMEWATGEPLLGCVEHVHHKDRDKSNWAIDNLELIDSHDHASMHGKETYARQDHSLRIERLREALKFRRPYDGDENPNWRGGKLVVACEVCGKPVECWPSQQKSYCSDECRSIGLSRSRTKPRVEIVCGTCGKKFEVAPGLSHREFCSRACANRGTAARGRCAGPRKNYCVVKVEVVRQDWFYSITVPESGCYVSTNGLINKQSQIEFRLIVHYIQDLAAIAAYAADPDTDFHQWVADMCGIARRPAKNVNFAIAFGGGKKKIVSMLASNMDLVGNMSTRVDELITEGKILDSQRQEAFALLCTQRGEQVYNQYHDALPTLRTTSNRAAKNLELRGYVFNVYGRQRHLPVKASYRAFNTIMQSCAADAMKERTVAVAPRYNSWTREHGIVLTASVHDETLTNTPHEVAQDVTVLRTFAEMLEDTAVKFRVPMRTSCGRSSKNWADAGKKVNAVKFR